MGEKVRCAVIGTGAIGLEHLNSLIHCPRAAAVAICETHPQRAREAGERYKIPRTYSDYRELLEQPDIDAVIVAVPNHLHAPIAIEALKARKHVLLEKPMAMNAKEAAKIIDTAENMRRTLLVGMNYRFDRQTQLARAIIQRGDLGEVYHARTFWNRRGGIPRIGSWFTQKQFAGGGCVADIGVHLLDVCLHLIGEFEVASVTAHTHARFGPRGLGEFDWGKSEIDPKKTFDVEDCAIALIRLKSGRTVLLESSWAANHASDAREKGVDLFGTQAGLSLFPAKIFRNGPNGYETIQLAAPKVALPEDRVQHFVSCIVENKKPAVLPQEALKVQKAIDAIYSSASTGREVRLNSH